jgi:hypothetical protein
MKLNRRNRKRLRLIEDLSFITNNPEKLLPAINVVGRTG